ncbi:MAG: FkbM family methyltransferase [Elusimicrobiota bacterium]|nr:FkbM family methyltransferase [Elusimicrobiota bacterium]
MNDLSADEIRRSISKLLAKEQDYRQEVRNRVERYKYVVFYGCGNIFHGIVSSWNRHAGRRVDFCCDSDSRKWGKEFSGLKCISPDELAKIKNECAVYVTIGDFAPVLSSLLDKGFPFVDVVSKNALDIAAFIASEPQEEILSALCKTYGLLADKRSREVFEAIVQRVLDAGSRPGIMAEVCEKDQYFPAGLIRLSEHESLADIGAFNGDTVRDFTERTRGRFDNIFSFEVDAVNFKSLEKTIRDIPGHERIKAFNLGAWDSERDITYSIGLSQSTVGTGEGKGHVAPLDDVLKNEKVTLIKMDIEGAEPMALRGAGSIIRTQKPKLAICVYHDFRHLWEIPLYIRSLVPEYRIYLRHHTCLEYETVCYALL